MGFGEQDLRALFRTGPCVTFNGVGTYRDGQPVQGLLDRPIGSRLAEQGFGGVDVVLPELRLPHYAFNPMPRVKEVIVVEGIEYKVASITAEDDGAVVCLELKST